MDFTAPVRKWTIHISNFFLLITGIIVITFGAYSIQTLKEISHAVPKMFYISIPITLITLGSVLILGSILAFIGVANNNIFFMRLYAAIILFVFVLQIIFGITITWVVDDDHKMEQNVNKTVLEIFQNGTKVSDFLQTTFNCCGTTGPNYWTEEIPKSCCDSSDFCNLSKSHQRGCQGALYTFVLLTQRIIHTWILSVSLLEVIAAALCLSLVNSIQDYIKIYGKYN